MPSLTTVISSFLLAANNARSLNIVLGNDDGWAVANIRAMYDALEQNGHNVVLSAPAENKSGTGSLDLPAMPVLTGCQFESCPALSAAQGSDAGNPKLNYVNSFPVTAMNYGINTLSPKFFNDTAGKPQLVVTGPNVGDNVGLLDGQFSGTLGAASAGAKVGIPAIAFSSITGEKVSYKERPTGFSETYAGLAATFVADVTKNADPLLPEGVFLSVNYNALDYAGGCTKPRYVLSRTASAIPVLSPKDVTVCNNGGRLPTEAQVMRADGCFASVTVLDAKWKLDVGAELQKAVADRLNGVLACITWPR